MGGLALHGNPARSDLSGLHASLSSGLQAGSGRGFRRFQTRILQRKFLLFYEPLRGGGTRRMLSQLASAGVACCRPLAATMEIARECNMKRKTVLIWINVAVALVLAG